MVRGLDSGQPTPVTPDYWEEVKRKLADDQAADLAGLWKGDCYADC